MRSTHCTRDGGFAAQATKTRWLPSNNGCLSFSVSLGFDPAPQTVYGEWIECLGSIPDGASGQSWSPVRQDTLIRQAAEEEQTARERRYVGSRDGCIIRGLWLTGDLSWIHHGWYETWALKRKVPLVCRFWPSNPPAVPQTAPTGCYPAWSGTTRRAMQKGLFTVYAPYRVGTDSMTRLSLMRPLDGRLETLASDFLPFPTNQELASPLPLPFWPLG